MLREFIISAKKMFRQIITLFTYNPDTGKINFRA